MTPPKEKLGNVWPIFMGFLEERGSSDLFKRIIDATGLGIAWPPLDSNDGYSNQTRIRAYRPLADKAIQGCEEGRKKTVICVMAKELVIMKNKGFILDDKFNRLKEKLSSIGWSFDENGLNLTGEETKSLFIQNGKPHDAYIKIQEIMDGANSEIVIIDPYLHDNILIMVKHKHKHRNIKILTNEKNTKETFKIECEKFIKQQGKYTLEVKSSDKFHDRYLILDDQSIFLIGGSIKDLGNKATTIIEFQDDSTKDSIREWFSEIWKDSPSLINP